MSDLDPFDPNFAEQLRSMQPDAYALHQQLINDNLPVLVLKNLASRIADQQLQRGVNPREMTPAQRKHYASECALALQVEVSELASSWAFASWKTTPTDIVNIEREIVDCIFFLHNIASMFFITPEALLKRFEWVLFDNQARIDSGVHKEVQLSNE